MGAYYSPEGPIRRSLGWGFDNGRVGPRSAHGERGGHAGSKPCSLSQAPLRLSAFPLPLRPRLPTRIPPAAAPLLPSAEFAAFLCHALIHPPPCSHYPAFHAVTLAIVLACLAPPPVLPALFSPPPAFKRLSPSVHQSCWLVSRPAPFRPYHLFRPPPTPHAGARHSLLTHRARMAGRPRLLPPVHRAAPARRLTAGYYGRRALQADTAGEQGGGEIGSRRRGEGGGQWGKIRQVRRAKDAVERRGSLGRSSGRQHDDPSRKRGAKP